MNDVLPYIFSLVDHSKKYSLVCKLWNELYIKALGRYKITVRFNEITDKGIKYIEKLDKYRNIRSLLIINSGMTILPNFNNIEVLRLYICDSIKNINIYKNLVKIKIGLCENIKYIPNIPDVFISECENINYEQIIGNNTKKLSIDKCHAINKLIITGNITKLKINDCEGLEKIIYNSNGIMNSNRIYSLKKLKIIHCRNFTHISSMINPYELYISECRSLNALSNFISLRKLTIKYCFRFTLINNYDIESLYLLGSPYIEDLDKLTNLYELHIEPENIPLVDISRIKKIYIYYYDNFIVPDYMLNTDYKVSIISGSTNKPVYIKLIEKI